MKVKLFNSNPRDIFFLLLFFVSSSSVFAVEKQFYFFGGGGDPAGDETIFDGNIKPIAQFVNTKKSSWKFNYSFDGGHPGSEKKLRASFNSKKSLGPFTKENFEKSIVDLEQKLETDQFKKGDQLLLTLFTHGALNNDAEKSHSISLVGGAAKNLKTLEGSEMISLDRLEKLTLLAKEKGVKVALIDLSCFSGNTLKLSNENVCVISGSSADNYSYGDGDAFPRLDFEGRFLAHLKKGKNLEDIFLAARDGDEMADGPMISTSTGLLVNDFLDKFINPFLVFNNEEEGTYDFTEKYKSSHLDENLCKSEDQFTEALKQIQELKKIPALMKKSVDLKALEGALEDYRAYQISYEKTLKGAQSVREEIKVILSRDFANKAKYFEREDLVDFFSSDKAEAKARLKGLINSNENEYLKKGAALIYDDILIKESVSTEIYKNLTPASKKKLKDYENFFSKEDKTGDLATGVAIEAKKIYTKLYKANMKNDQSPNPCRDFVI